MIFEYLDRPGDQDSKQRAWSVQTRFTIPLDQATKLVEIYDELSLTDKSVEERAEIAVALMTQY